MKMKKMFPTPTALRDLLITAGDKPLPNVSATHSEQISQSRHYRCGYDDPRNEQHNGHSKDFTPGGQLAAQKEHQTPKATSMQGTAAEHSSSRALAPIADEFCAEARAEEAAKSHQVDLSQIHERSLPPLPCDDRLSEYRQIDSHGSFYNNNEIVSGHTNTAKANDERLASDNDSPHPDATGTRDSRFRIMTRRALAVLRDEERGQQPDQQKGGGGREIWSRHQTHQAFLTNDGLGTIPNHSKAAQESTAPEQIETKSRSPIYTPPSGREQPWLDADRTESARTVDSDRLTAPGPESNVPPPYTYDSQQRLAHMQGIEALHQDQQKIVPPGTMPYPSCPTQTHPLANVNRTGGAIIIENDALSARNEIYTSEEDARSTDDGDTEGLDTSNVSLAASWAAEEEASPHDLSQHSHESRLREALKRHKRDRDTIQDLQKQVREHNRQYRLMKVRWEGAVDALAQFRQHSTSKIDDASIKAAYGDISFAVQNWVRTYCNMAPIPKPSKRTKTYLKKLTPSWQTYMREKDSMHLLIQSLLMNWLSSEVLTCERDAGLWWAGALHEGLKIMIPRLEPGESHTPTNNPRTTLTGSREGVPYPKAFGNWVLATSARTRICSLES